MSKRYGGRQPLTLPQHRLTVAPREVLERRPLRQASEQMRAGDEGLRYRPNYELPAVFDVVPKTRSAPYGVEELRGLRWGRMTIIGLLDDRDFPAPARHKYWVCRCDCGTIEARRHRSAVARRNPDEKCGQCTYLRNLKRIERMNAGRPPALGEEVVSRHDRSKSRADPIAQPPEQG